ncbi:Crp/Fnr family transcriptional regulator [Pontibacter sp. BT310]|uniref:Crp/Fnr family transcriptional regulator n=1 Tax=Pontibacter populi TaxID=890055 RepID=A0ABS6XEP1_9BACT|nr:MULTISPECIES: Crp/Fnr family transcriptional regulator [Pontibacter]MBJ6119611.1 Crp/Fnr family transcriptional regulator [Pontibacter sp. BT310]MBR0572038.1 Crp/Fnr family transcriptional regulator [Microvirga sp. STS03]MBW3366464.1 Crp/Fnr family transcriptional regulator [Pontibacter populi]
MQTIPKELVLKKFPTLEDSLLDELLAESTLKEVGEGEEVMRSGQYITSTILLLRGLLKVYREDDEGNEFMMYYLEAGNACAMSMMCTARNEKSQIMVKAVTDAEVLLVPSHLSELWLGKYKTWHNFVIASYRQRFEELLQTLDSIAFKGLDERLLFYLKSHVKVSGNEVKLSHQQIANELNSSREVISRLLKKLEQTGAITLHRNYIEVHDLTIV